MSAAKVVKSVIGLTVLSAVVSAVAGFFSIVVWCWPAFVIGLHGDALTEWVIGYAKGTAILIFAVMMAYGLADLWDEGP